MKRKLVESRSICSIGYDNHTQTLEIEFNSGEVYQYYAVPSRVHRDLLAASSIGQYFAHFIKTTYQGEKVTLGR
jgi:hypothetical protein